MVGNTSGFNVKEFIRRLDNFDNFSNAVRLLFELEGMLSGAIRKAVFIHLIEVGPTHFYRIARDLEKLGISKSWRAVYIEVMRLLRKGVLVVIRKKKVKERKRTIIDINWSLFADAIIKYLAFLGFDTENITIIRSTILSMGKRKFAKGRKTTPVVKKLKKKELKSLEAFCIVLLFAAAQNPDILNLITEAISRHVVARILVALKTIELITGYTILYLKKVSRDG